MTWISIDDRLPKHAGRYLVSYDGYVGVGSFGNGEWDTYPDYWQPLLEPPIDEEADSKAP